MTIEEIKQKLTEPEYDFLRTNPHLGSNIIMLGVSGSHGYGMNVESSDCDCRGIALNTKKEILTGNCFEQVLDNPTDTTIYSFNKIINLFASCNPNTIEMLGLKPEYYLQLTPIGEMLIKNRHMFLSKRAVNTFGSYAHGQFRRLQSKAARLVSQAEQEEHILQSIKHASHTFKERYFNYPEDAIKLYIDKAVQEGYDTEVFMDVVLNHYPLRDFKDLWSEMHAIVKSYSKIGKRNEHAIEHNKLGKHMAHLARLYFMCFDILKEEEIITYREKEHDLLMSIRNGEYLDENRQPVPKFFDMVDKWEKQLDEYARTTKLPDHPDMKKIDELKMSVNEIVVMGNQSNT